MWVCWIITLCLYWANRDDAKELPDDYVSPVPTLNTVSAEKRLVMQLTSNYSVLGTNGRPLSDVSHPLKVLFGLGLVQMALNEHDKVLTTSMWARYRWKDEYLTWDPEDYGNISNVKLSPDIIWKPDIMLYNTAETDSSERHTLLTVNNKGYVMWVPHQIFRSSCSINITNFPFDHQSCTLWFGSWTHSLQEMDVQLAFDGGIDLTTFDSDYKESCSWEVMNNTALRDEQPPENPTYVMLTFTLEMRRKIVFSTYILTLPCIFLAALTLVVFWLPPDRPDRTALAMNIFGSFLVLLLILVEAAPPTASSVPSLGVYYCFNMVIIMMSIFLSSMVVNVSRGSDEKRNVPRLIHMVFINGLARVLCPNVYELVVRTKIKQNPDIKRENKYKGRNSTNNIRCPERIDLLSLEDLNHTTRLNGNVTSCEEPHSGDYNSSIASCALETELRGVRSILSNISSEMMSAKRAREKQMYINLQWRCVALVMDRLFFILYTIVIGLSLSLLFPRPYT